MMIRKTSLAALCTFTILLSSLIAAVDGIERELRSKGGRKSSDDCGFTTKDIEGRFGFSAQGFIFPPSGVGPLNAVSLGILEFFKDGSCEFTISANGEAPGGFTNVTTADACSYDLQPTGLGTILVEDDGLNVFTGEIPLSFVLVKGGEELRFIRADAIGLAEGVGIRQYICGH